MIEKLLGFVMVLTRISAFFLVLPVFGWVSIPAQVKAAMTILTAVFFSMITAVPVDARQVSVVEAILLLANEATYGLALGLVAALLFSAVKFGGRIAHGLLGLTVAAGLSQAMGHLEGTFLAFLGLEWNYKLPIYIGDTVHEEQVVSSRRETRDLSRGIITIDCRLVNQKGEVVQEGQRTIMVARRGTED